MSFVGLFPPIHQDLKEQFHLLINHEIVKLPRYMLFWLHCDSHLKREKEHSGKKGKNFLMLHVSSI